MPDDVPTGCDLYLRQSRDFTGEELAITRQREDCEALVQRRGWPIRATHVDNDTSAAGKVHRPGFEAFLSAVIAGQVRVVVSWNLDRLTRNARDRLRLLEVGKEHGLTIALVRGSDLDLSTPSGRLTADILGSVAQHEIDQKADRQRRAALQRSELGKPPMGVRLTGYTTAGEIVEAEAVVVRDLFRQFLAGESLRSLRASLEASGVTPRHGGRWNPSTVRTILTNPRYAGRAIYQGKLTGKAGAWTPLVDDATFDAVQVKLSDPRRRSQVGTDRKYLGSGLYRCGVCGDAVTSWTGARYRCQRGCLSRSQGPVDLFVVEVLRSRLARRDLADLLPAQEDENTKRLSAELAGLRARLATIESDYDAGHIDGRRFAVASEKITTQIRAIEASLARAGAARGAAGLLEAANPVAYFDAASLMSRRTIISALCVVELLPVPRGRKGFDPATVRITPRVAA